MGTELPQDETPTVDTRPDAVQEAACSDIPWERHPDGGLSRAFWSTVYYVLRRRGQIADQIGNVASLDCVKKFRRAAFLYAAGGWVATATIALILLTAIGSQDDPFDSGGNESFIVGAALAIKVFTLLLGMSVSAWFFAWPQADRETEDRAIAIGYYCCAPLALVAAAPFVFLASLSFLPADRILAAGSYTALAAMLAWAMWGWLTVNVSGRIKGRNAKGNLRATGALAALWIFLHVSVPATPKLAYMWVVMWTTLR